MGMLTETNILTQLKKGQGETNKRLDALLEAQKVTNAWLARIAELLEQQTPVPIPQPGYQQPGYQQQPQVYGQRR